MVPLMRDSERREMGREGRTVCYFAGVAGWIPTDGSCVSTCLLGTRDWAGLGYGVVISVFGSFDLIPRFSCKVLSTCLHVLPSESCLSIISTSALCFCLYSTLDES